MLMLRSIGPQARAENRVKVDSQMEEWRDAVKLASAAEAEWPVFVNEEGFIRGVDDDVDVAGGVLDSVMWVVEHETA